ncbi:hypothetical protein RHGRI_025554 [Rhododendron griersonianum]|uniref:Uncharacterized protein n=1 Tax=Rhododendron griersonianum TaxID=479676 RepID=A0AAV6IPK4_9ERIC|nr:hypothetical protein RHGRI_025554 [Rhododendron griersonianum]
MLQRELHEPLPAEQAKVEGTIKVEPMSYKLVENNNTSPMTDDQKRRTDTYTFKTLHNPKGTAEYISEAVPVSYKYPDSKTIYRMENPKVRFSILFQMLPKKFQENTGSKRGKLMLPRRQSSKLDNAWRPWPNRETFGIDQVNHT